MSVYAGVFLLSAAALLFEIHLTRLFSVAQFYHFAFMIVSLALLGLGASGTFLALFPARSCERAETRGANGAGACYGFAVTALGSYLLTLYIPFDSFRIAREWRQGLVLALHYAALAAPFFFSGIVVGRRLAARPESANRTYAANLAGAACGCLLAVTLPSLVGGAGTVLISAALALLAAVAFRLPISRPALASCLLPLASCLLLILAAFRPPAFLEVRISPYKGLSYALLYPDAEVVFRRWNGFSRVDVVKSSHIRSLPGSGFRCAAHPPAQLGLLVDGDDLSPISQATVGLTSAGFSDCLLTALPYRLRPAARALVLEPRGGFDVLIALAEGARHVTAVESNPLIVEAVRAQGAWAGHLYDDPRVTVVEEEGRAYTRRTRERYDVVMVALTASQHPVASGAYSLAEDYRYTVEAFTDYLARLEADGLLVVMRWLQTPPSEETRAFALAVEAIERGGGDPATCLVALRSYQQMLILARRGPFTAGELAAIRAFAASRAFDLVYAPDIRPAEVNRYNVLPEPYYYHAFTGLLTAEDREAWYRDYPFDVRPPTDNHPFFNHFFKWRQAAEVWAMAGHTWQPFGGAGYFVLLALLVLAVCMAGVLILLPLALRTGGRREGPAGATLGYFGLLGLGYLCVEIPLLQQFILFLGHPAYATAAVLFALLAFSGLGSLLARRVPLWAALGLLLPLVGGYALGLPLLLRTALVLPPEGRMAVTVAALAPPGLLMGIPFPRGLALLEQASRGLIAWAWGVNGAVSVVASILAALTALSGNFTTVLAVGAACYAGALFTAAAIRAPHSPARPRR